MAGYTLRHPWDSSSQSDRTLVTPRAWPTALRNPPMWRSCLGFPAPSWRRPLTHVFVLVPRRHNPCDAAEASSSCRWALIFLVCSNRYHSIRWMSLPKSPLEPSQSVLTRSWGEDPGNQGNRIKPVGGSGHVTAIQNAAILPSRK